MPPPFHGTLNVPFIFVPLKALSDQVWIGYPCFCCWKFILICGFVEKVTRISCLKEWLEKLKTTLASIFFIWLWFQVYRCKSSIAWRVTRNCAYIPFNNNFLYFFYLYYWIIQQDQGEEILGGKETKENHSILGLYQVIKICLSILCSL